MLRLFQAIFEFCNQAFMRLLLAAGVFAFTCWWMAEPVLSGSVVRATPYVLIGFPLIVVAAIIAAPQIARAIADWVYDLFSASEKFDKPQPMYGKPMALRKSRQYEEAMAMYEEMAEEHPEEIKPWLEMIDTAQRDLKDPARAELIYQSAILKFEDQKDLERLANQLTGVRLKS